MIDVMEAAREYSVELERDLAALTEFDREWASMVAGRRVTDREALELKRDYEDWVATMGEVFG